mmetsp:Transcript_66818/g.195369  ORF Transcript_66818/g.195369 Transcript_66818/m.195369 type:complete len:232 (+) Transcript_66818:916-1611(+)
MTPGVVVAASIIIAKPLPHLLPIAGDFDHVPHMLSHLLRRRLRDGAVSRVRGRVQETLQEACGVSPCVALTTASLVTEAPPSVPPLAGALLDLPDLPDQVPRGRASGLALAGPEQVQELPEEAGRVHPRVVGPAPAPVAVALPGRVAVGRLALRLPDLLQEVLRWHPGAGQILGVSLHVEEALQEFGVVLGRVTHVPALGPAEPMPELPNLEGLLSAVLHPFDEVMEVGSP